jgi:hypothetical protein
VKKKVEAIIYLIMEANADCDCPVKCEKIASDPITSRIMMHDLIGHIMQSSLEHDPVAMVATEIHMCFSIAKNLGI